MEKNIEHQFSRQKRADEGSAKVGRQTSLFFSVFIDVLIHDTFKVVKLHILKLDRVSLLKRKENLDRVQDSQRHSCLDLLFAAIFTRGQKT